MIPIPELISHYLAFGVNLGMDEILSLAVGVFALVLLAVSFGSYLKTGLRRMLLVSGTFALFAANTLFHHVGVLFLNWGAQTEDIVFTAMDLLILILFFLAITAKR